MQEIPLRSGGRRLLLLPLQLLGIDDRRDAGLATRAVIFGCEVLRTHEMFTRNLTLLEYVFSIKTPDHTVLLCETKNIRELLFRSD